jgi:NADH pyrophosphatase NudC (nudix superfamily)
VISPPAASGASFVGDDGVPFFALSDADRASELRANPEAIAAAAASPDAVLLPLSGTKVWIFPDDDDARSESERESHVRWRPAEAAVRDVPEDALDRGALSFLGFRARDGAPVFCADVTPGAMDAAVRSAVLRREKKSAGAGAGAGAGDVVVADAKSVAPEMRRADAGLLAAAAGLARWQRTVRFCSECGSRTVLIKAGHKARCADDTGAQCRGAFYPKLMPAVLTLCTCGDYALLGRNSKWPRGFYSCLAGFVDQSESLEQAVAREVLEESGVAIDERSTTYVASQPWPFPCQLMVGFEAKAAARTVELTPEARDTKTQTRGSSVFSYPPTPNLDIHELRDARWFHRDWLREELRKNLGDPREPGNPREIPLGSVAVPGAHALARHLIERWVFGECSGTAFASGDRESGLRSNSNSIEAVGLAGGAAAPRAPATNRPYTFVLVDFVGAGGGTRTSLRIQPTGGGGRAHRQRPRAAPRGCRARSVEARGGARASFAEKRFSAKDWIIARRKSRLERRHERCSSHT